MATNTCNDIVSTSCLRWQGDKLSFSSTLKDRRSVEEIVKKLDENLVKLSDLVNTNIDKKWMVGTFENFSDYIQVLIDEVGELKTIVSNPNVITPSIDLNGTCVGITSDKTTVSYDEAFILIFQELCNIKDKLNVAPNKIYLPNV